MEKGDSIICAVQSGDRDEEVSTDPDKFDIHRKLDPSSVLGFGYGLLRCLAETFSRQQLEVALSKCRAPAKLRELETDRSEASLFQKIPNLKLAVPESDLKWSPLEQNVGILELPVNLGY